MVAQFNEHEQADDKHSEEGAAEDESLHQGFHPASKLLRDVQLDH